MTFDEKFSRASVHALEAGMVAEEAMQPYMDILGTPDGIIPMMMLADVHRLCIRGMATPKGLAMAIKQASEMTGIPIGVLQLHIAFADALFDEAILTAWGYQ
jgi:hypothetical protein